MSTQPIGVFDSGIGGISIWKEIITLLPYENTIYLADSKNAPYGQKSKEEILHFSIKNTEKLIEKGCKIIVVACNTATTNAIAYLRQHYNIPIIGIEPAIKPAALQTTTNTIGILATKGTLSSALFSKTSDTIAPQITVLEQIGEGLVPLIETGKIDTPEMEQLLQQYLIPMLEKNIDYLVLGCSHYPFLIPKIKKIVGTGVTIIDSGQAVAKQTKAVLQQHELLNSNELDGSHQLHSNIDTKTLVEIVKGLPQLYTVSHLDF
tara:strand:+ start:454731 stop:455519 length:789 start_codon:yes stop_codon:yes gene_type:complete